ncbi:MAG: acyl-CoA acyltransferase [Hyphomicrobiales bacterium]
MVNASSKASQVKIRCRQILDRDIPAIVDLLTKGFPERGRQYWLRGLERQRVHPVAPGYPTYGYLLENDGAPVGVVLLLFASVEADGQTTTRCNISSWYVEPAFRSHASLLVSFALRHKEVTYLNVSPAKHTWSTVEAQGFRCYSSGQFLAAAALNRASRATVREVQAGAPRRAHASMPEAELLIAHAGYGCLSLVCTAADGAHPFVFLPLKAKKGPFRIPCAQLIYCRDIAAFTRFAGALGRFLLKRGALFVALDANGPVDGLIGTYRESWGRKYFKGPNTPRLGDLAYTELVLFGP